MSEFLQIVTTSSKSQEKSSKIDPWRMGANAKTSPPVGLCLDIGGCQTMGQALWLVLSV